MSSRTYSISTSWDALDSRRFQNHHLERKIRRHRNRCHRYSFTPPAYKLKHIESSLKVLAPASEKNDKAVDYYSYSFTE